MSLRVLGRLSSINVRKVLWTCDEIGVPFALEAWGSGFQSTDTPAFRALNPNAMVPVIIDAGQALWESNTICRYLAQQHGRTDLLPQEAMPRAQIEKWMDWQATELNNSWRYAFMGYVRGSPAHADPKLLAAGVAEWNRHMAILDAQLDATGAFAAGATFTLADVVLGLSVHRWAAAPIAHADLPAVQTYYARLSERAAFLAHGRNGHP